MLCPACGRDNPLHARFCGHCGNALAPNDVVELQPTSNAQGGMEQDIASRLRDSMNRLVGPFAEELRRVNRSASSQERNAKNYLKSELAEVFVHFATVDGTITPGRAKFFLQIFGVLDPVSYKGFGVENALALITNMSKSVTFIMNWQKPLSVTLLHGYDALHGTRYAGDAIALLTDLASATISANGKPSSIEQVEVERFKDTLNAAHAQPDLPTIEKKPDKAVDAASLAVPSSQVAQQTKLNGLPAEFQTFSKSIASKVNEMLKSATVLGPDGKPQDLRDFNENLSIDLHVLAAEFSKTAGVVSDVTAEFIVSATDERGAFLLASPSGPELVNAVKNLIEGEWKQTPTSPGEPITVTILAMYDENCGTHYAEEARNLFTRLVSKLAEEAAISGKAAPDLLKRYNAILTPYQQKPAEVTPSDTQQEAGADTFDGLMAELQGLIGLAKVKNDVVELSNFIKIQQMRKSRGLKTPELSLHMVFYGSPGTGKTTVARLLAKIYKSLGVLTRGQLVETDRSGLVAGYVGQTALKVKEVVEKALGGVLFIDEAYALKPKNDSGDFGAEAVETLLKLMEDNRGNLIVIAAGYTSEMTLLLASNPGLHSRFNKYLDFEDYGPDELMRIFRRFCSESQYSLDDAAASKLETLFDSAFQRRDAHFGNARLARNAFEQAITNMATRIVNLAKIEDSALETIHATDIPDEIVTGLPTDSQGPS